VQVGDFFARALLSHHSILHAFRTFRTMSEDVFQEVGKPALAPPEKCQ
jgi:hypothetical protein